ncbi:MAG: enoyl-CoA hydratase/isomerase family protein [Deltaproteobacteria bacterium]|nr:enoyl-CoA hydratase/isomerase family protein [Deltaproteobacteria bacterium]
MSISKNFDFKVEEDVGIITIDVPDAPMNTWTEDGIKEFGELVGELEKRDDLKGVILISGKSNNFHAGANLNMLQAMKNRKDVLDGLDLFHSAFNKMESFKFPVIAAINGHCLGGGLELALACTARIAKESPTTIIGLPECLVGVFPGGGGTQRLPRLIGYNAVDLILRGKTLPAAKALEAGIIDRVVGADADILEEAKKFLDEIVSKKVELKRPTQDLSQIDDIAEMARQGVLKVTRGREIPGPMLAIKAIKDGVKVSFKEGIEIEKNCFADVVLSDQAKGGINTFFLKIMSDKPRSMMSKGFEPKPLRKAAVLGFGTMGRGIIVEMLRRMQVPVIVKDIPEALEPGKAALRKILDGMAQRKRLKVPVDDLMNLLIVTSEYIDDFKDVDIVVEAVFEDPKVKAEVYKELCEIVPEDCILASNTSSIPITQLAKDVKNPERFVGTHFFSPVWRMELLEIIRGEKTSQETVDNALNFAAAIRKRPIVCRDNPGFVVNAMLFPYFTTSLDLIGKGVPIEKVDKAMTSFGMPVGPIRLIDEVGIDVPYKAMKSMGVTPPEVLKNVVEAGRYGVKKSGKGFFLVDGSVDPEVLPLIPAKEKKDMTEEEIQDLLFTEMLKIAKELLDHKIVDDPRAVDIGMVWGTGFPPDKGGPLKWADLTGVSERLFGKKFYQD